MIRLSRAIKGGNVRGAFRDSSEVATLANILPGSDRMLAQASAEYHDLRIGAAMRIVPRSAPDDGWFDRRLTKKLFEKKLPRAKRVLPFPK
ncbi:MAG: hypothetical protein K2P80_14755 [Beijerinckiaceae bacterium]|nr:hypothetical protein [Beijerinckiaceae bacterium]